MVGKPAWICFAIGSGMPTSCATSIPISSMRAARPAESFCSMAARSATGVCDQDGNAAFAAATARSTSAGVPSGIRAMTSSVLELVTSRVPVPAGFTHLPPM